MITSGTEKKKGNATQSAAVAEAMDTRHIPLRVDTIQAIVIASLDQGVQAEHGVQEGQEAHLDPEVQADIQVGAQDHHIDLVVAELHLDPTIPMPWVTLAQTTSDGRRTTRHITPPMEQEVIQRAMHTLQHMIVEILLEATMTVELTPLAGSLVIRERCTNVIQSKEISMGCTQRTITLSVFFCVFFFFLL